MNRNALERALVENPLPPRAFVLMSEPELRLLDFHEPATAELKRRQARKKAKRDGDLLALRETESPKGGKDAELRVLTGQLFTAAA